MKTTLLFSKYLILFVMVFTPHFFFAQPHPGFPNCWPPPCIPIDGGITIFTFISILFGYKLVSKNK